MDRDKDISFMNQFLHQNLNPNTIRRCRMDIDDLMSFLINYINIMKNNNR